MILIGIGLAVQSWGALLVIVLIFGIVYGYRIHIGEKTLIAHIGKEYNAYMMETKMLIPFIIRKITGQWILMRSIRN